MGCRAGRGALARPQLADGRVVALAEMRDKTVALARRTSLSEWFVSGIVSSLCFGGVCLHLLGPCSPRQGRRHASNGVRKLSLGFTDALAVRERSLKQPTDPASNEAEQHLLGLQAMTRRSVCD